MIRPEAVATLRRWREVAGSAAILAFGLWMFSLGGWILAPAGIGLVALALGLGVIALRRMRFARGGSAPGVVEVDEGQVGYFGPDFGGFLSLRELVEIRLVDLHGVPRWRLKQADGQVLLIPASAKGAEALFDAFAALPGIDMGRLTAALDARENAQVLWQRPARAALT
ncbi:hypothetical protein [Ostreiculturibacter nitratireducens]|uniref:hypothetical protein n=1 Tax=Ostreiculturibacter nitratireducens TaxID=3075226 RepID=UPI0031B632F8